MGVDLYVEAIFSLNHSDAAVVVAVIDQNSVVEHSYNTKLVLELSSSCFVVVVVVVEVVVAALKN